MAIEPNDPHTDQKLLGEVLERLPAPALSATEKEQLGSRLAERLRATMATASATGISAIRASEGVWHRLGHGIQIKPLRADLQSGTQTSLWRIEAGAKVPRHAHHHEEECLVVSGRILMAGVRYESGDFVLACDGSEHPEFLAETETVLLIRGQLERALRPLFAQTLSLSA